MRVIEVDEAVFRMIEEYAEETGVSEAIEGLSAVLQSFVEEAGAETGEACDALLQEVCPAFSDLMIGRMISS